jgi:hypothetical protein
MTGYFSQLIQQSGIVVGRGHETPSESAPSASGGFTDPQEVESGDIGDLLPVEEVEVTVPLTEPSPPLGASSLEGEAIAPPIEIREGPQTLERSVEREIIPPASASSEPSTESFLSASTRASHTEFVIQEEPAAAVDRDRIPIQEQEQESVNLSQERKPISSSTIPEGTIVIEQSEIELLEEKRRDILSPQTYWQVVREWVTDTPQKDKGVQAVDVSRGSADFELTETAIVKEPQQPRIVPERVKPIEDTLRVAHQELVLSIGSIQVTVEQPTTAVKPPVPPAPQPKPVTQPSLESSRLRRRYIRFR